MITAPVPWSIDAVLLSPQLLPAAVTPMNGMSAITIATASPSSASGDARQCA
jgi:hypothetical protein